MTLDEKIVEAVATAEVRYDGYDDLLALSRTMRERYLDRARAAITAYQAEASKKRQSGAHKIAMAIRDIEEGNLAAVHFNGQVWRPERPWQDISTAPPLERVLVAGWQPHSANVAGYWWYHEDTTDETGRPMEHTTALKWLSWPSAPRGFPDCEYEDAPAPKSSP